MDAQTHTAKVTLQRLLSLSKTVSLPKLK